MKKRIVALFLLMSLVMMGLTACGGDDPVSVAKDFIAALKEEDSARINKICTEEFAKEANEMIAQVKFAKDNFNEFKLDGDKYEYEIKDNKATVSFELIYDFGSGEITESANIYMIKKDGKWIIEGVD